MLTKFTNAQQAFEYYYDYISYNGIETAGTKALFNVGFTLEDPLDPYIKTPWRKWKNDYAMKEWQWYISQDRSIDFIGQHAKLWHKMVDEKGLVNSNYGYQWNRNDQLNKAVMLLEKDPQTRKASISLYDGKEIDQYTHDTVCTYVINFRLDDQRYLHMSVLMRSNDLWYGFCNDQYCFSLLMLNVSLMLRANMGTYHHFANNLHIYHRHLNKKTNESDERIPTDQGLG